MTTTSALTDLTGLYGHNYTEGVLVDDLPRILDAQVRVLRSGRTWIAPAKGGRALPVLCGELIEVRTEDGPITGRCGIQVLDNGYACEGHTQEREGWMAMSEIEKAAWEYNLDQEMGW